ncbi:MAG: glycosyltransferase [Dehalococcoidales bacterium]|nr:glycosyltransferase [Dehalococcoidales bacterium]
MNILFIHEIDWLKKVVFEIHTLSELLSIFGHNVYVIDYESMWQKDGFFDFGSLRTRVIDNVERAYPGAKVELRRPGFIKIPGVSRFSALFTQHREIQRTIKEKKIDAIVLYSVPTSGWQAVNLAKKYNMPVVFRSIDVLNQMVTSPLLRPLTRLLEKRVYSRVDYILALTPKMSKYVVDLGADPDRVGLLLIPVDTDMFKPAPVSEELRRRWGLNAEDAVILFMGTLFDFSGLDILIRHFSEVLNEVPQARLLIVGDGPQRPALEKIIAETGMQKSVVITGFQPYDTMPQYINMSMLCINTFLVNDTTRDIFPSKIVQYLACGRAVVATRLPGMEAVIQGEEQGVAYGDSADKIPGKIIALLKAPEDRKKLERAGLAYARENHSNERIVRQLEQKLIEAIKEKRKSS